LVEGGLIVEECVGSDGVVEADSDADMMGEVVVEVSTIGVGARAEMAMARRGAEEWIAAALFGIQWIVAGWGPMITLFRGPG